MTIKRINVSQCTAGIYLRWWFNGYHYFNFQNYYQISLQTEHSDIFTHDVFSRISKSTSPTKVKAGFSYDVIQEGISDGDSEGFRSLLLAEKVEQYEDATWDEVDISRGDFDWKDSGSPGYYLQFEITRKDLPGSSTQNYASIKLYIGDVLCELDDDEEVPINKQVNDIAEMQDRQSDFTQSFSIRRTKAMRALFERAGEPGADTTFPYENQTCKLIVDGVEIITEGNLILNSKEGDYYNVSVYSGNLNFFKAIEGLTLNDLTLAGTAHTWDHATQVGSNNLHEVFCYPLCIPNDDGGVTYTETDRVNLYGGWLWPFVLIKTIWDEIFSNAGFTPLGDILTNVNFLRLWMPITNLEVNQAETDNYLYSLSSAGPLNIDSNPHQLPGGYVTKGDSAFMLWGIYNTRYSATYRYRVIIICPGFEPTIYLYSDGVEVATFTKNTALSSGTYYYFDCEFASVAAEAITFWIYMPAYPVENNINAFWIRVTEIVNPLAGYSTVFTSLRDYLPNMTQTDFIKTICNMFALVPDTSARDRVVRFWNYLELYDNIPYARDWSNYLNEDAEVSEFKFGDYAQKNNLKYKDSEDVIKDTGIGSFLIADETLKAETTVVELPVCTCDEVLLVSDQTVSRIAMNKYDSATDTYKAEKSIDTRIVDVGSLTGANYMIIFDGFTGTVPSGSSSTTTSNCRAAKSVPVEFSSMIGNYSGLSRLLTRTKLNKKKFNLPVVEVSNLKHYIPIYLKQDNAYYYVNKVNNYIPGKLCTVDLIKL